MHRLFAVTSGYLKYTFLCMLGGTIIFSLAGLSVTNLKAFFMVMLIGLGAFLVVRMEMRSHRRTREISRRPERPHDAVAWAEVLSISQGLTAGLAAAYAPLTLLSTKKTERVPSDIQSILITQWNIQASSGSHQSELFRYKHDAEVVTNLLAARRDDLSRIGVYPIQITKAPSEDIVRMMQQDKTTRGWGNVLFKRITTEEPAQRSISIVFLSTGYEWPREIEQVLREALTIVGGHLVEAT